MHALVAALLITSTSSGPTLRPIPDGLAPALETPCKDCCTEPGVWLPQERADAIDLQRQQCKVLPERCQAALDEQTANCTAGKELQYELGRLEGIKEADQTPWGAYLTGGAIGVLVTLIAIGVSGLAR